MRNIKVKKQFCLSVGVQLFSGLTTSQQIQLWQVGYFCCQWLLSQGGFKTLWHFLFVLLSEDCEKRHSECLRDFFWEHLRVYLELREALKGSGATVGIALGPAVVHAPGPAVRYALGSDIILVVRPAVGPVGSVVGPALGPTVGPADSAVLKDLC